MIMMLSENKATLHWHPGHKYCALRAHCHVVQMNSNEMEAMFKMMSGPPVIAQKNRMIRFLFGNVVKYEE